MLTQQDTQAEVILYIITNSDYGEVLRVYTANGMEGTLFEKTQKEAIRNKRYANPFYGKILDAEGNITRAIQLEALKDANEVIINPRYVVAISAMPVNDTDKYRTVIHIAGPDMDSEGTLSILVLDRIPMFVNNAIRANPYLTASMVAVLDNDSESVWLSSAVEDIRDNGDIVYANRTIACVPQEDVWHLRQRLIALREANDARKENGSAIGIHPSCIT